MFFIGRFPVLASSMFDLYKDSPAVGRKTGERVEYRNSLSRLHAHGYRGCDRLPVVEKQQAGLIHNSNFIFFILLPAVAQR
jgi:hypothetical protein